MMRIKSILALAVLTLLAFNAQANICQENNGFSLIGGTDFYKNFLISADQIKQNYTFYYQDVDDALQINIEDSCDEDTTASRALESQHKKLCLSTCASEAIQFHETISTKYFKKRKIKGMTRECQSICNKTFN